MEHLQRRALPGLAGLVIALWLVLFIPAWTFQFWEAWVWWALFSVSVTLTTIYFLKQDPSLIERRVRAGPGAEREKHQKIIQVFESIFFILLLVIPGFDHRFGWSDVPVAGVIAGEVLTLISLSIIFLVFRENSYTSAIIEVGDAQPVISTGPYALVRHPMYAGAFVMLFGTALALGSYLALIPAAAMTGGIILRLIDEERFLIEHLPGYREYCEKTRFRLIPGVW